MFSGIVQSKERIVRIEKHEDTCELVIAYPKDRQEGLTIGASIAVSGICLTVTAFDDETVTFDATKETLSRSTLGSQEEMDYVNVERSIRVGDEIGGHILSGHVVGTVEIVSTEDAVWTFRVNEEWIKYIFAKGFIALDGCSLTVVEVDRDANTFTVAFIPETLERTTFGEKGVGDQVNLEIDHQTQAVVETVERLVEDAS